MKSYLQGHLKRLLSGIFKLDKETHDQSINWDGKVYQKNLEVDPDVLTKFSIDTWLPCTIVRGCVEELVVYFPWMSIGRDSISATAKNVFLLGKVDLRSIFDFDKMRRRNFDKSALAMMERKVVESFQQTAAKKANYFGALISGLLKSLQIHVENMRVRVEFVDLVDVVGGVEVILSEMNYDNNIQNMTESRFEGEIQTNGLTFVDLRAKSFTKDKLILMKQSLKDIRELPLEDFKKFFANESNPTYLIHPFLMHLSFTSIYSDEKKEKYTRLRTLEFSPLQLNISNEDIKLTHAILSIQKIISDYAYSKRLPFTLQFRASSTNPIDAMFIEGLRLNRLIHKCRAEIRLRQPGRVRATLAGFKALQTAYEFSYETKILHLMEHAYEKATDKLYDSLMTIITPSGKVQSVEEVIAKCEELEKTVPASTILYFRDHTMTKLRNQVYFKNKLLERKKYVKELQEKNGVISDILRKGISKIWIGSKKEQKHLDDAIVDSEGSVEDRAIKERLLKSEIRLKNNFEIKCPAVKIILTRNGKKLVEGGIDGIKIKQVEDYINKDGSWNFKIDKLKVSDDDGRVYLALSKKQEAEIKKGGAELSIPYTLYYDAERENFIFSGKSFALTLDNFILNASKDLVSKIVYFTMDFNSSSVAASSQVTPKVRKQSILPSVLNSIVKIDEVFKSFTVNLNCLIVVAKCTSGEGQIGLRTVPSFSVFKNEAKLILADTEIFYSDTVFDLEPCLNSPNLLNSVKKVIKKTTISFVTLRRTQSRLSLDCKLPASEIFFCDEILAIIAKIIAEVMSIKLFNKENLIVGLKKEQKVIKKKKPFTLQRPKNLLAGNLGFMHSRKPSRKASSTTFKTAGGGSEMGDDEFFDAFEDETDLFAHNELKSKLDLIEHAGMILGPELDIIQENDRTRYMPAKVEKLEIIELGLTLSLEDLALLFYAKNDVPNYIQITISQAVFFYDFSEMSLKMGELTLILKQNIISLIHKSYMTQISAIVKALQRPEDDKSAQNDPKKTTNAVLVHIPSEISPTSAMDSPQNMPSGQLPNSEPVEVNLMTNFRNLMNNISEKFTTSIEIRSLNVYATELVERTLTPGLYLNIQPILLNLAQKSFTVKSNLKMDVFNEDVGFYEPLIEELKVEYSTTTDTSVKMETKFDSVLVNVKPSILKNLLDYLSVYSTQKIKLSAERNSVITIKNDTGVGITYVVNQSGAGKFLKPFESVEVNLFVVARNQDNAESGEGKMVEEEDPSTDGKNHLANVQHLLTQIGRFSEDETQPRTYPNKTAVSTSFFSKKRIQLKIPSFGVSTTIDLSNLQDAHIHLAGNLFLVAKLEVNDYHTILNLQSNYRLTNKLDFDIECAVYLQKTPTYPKDELPHSVIKKRKKSEVFSEGDDISNPDSFDLSVTEKSRKFTFDNPLNILQADQPTEPSLKEERSNLQLKFIIKSKAAKFLPLLKNFPKNYYLIIWPAHVDFFNEVSRNPQSEFSQIRTQCSKASRVYFEELFRRNCAISKSPLTDQSTYPELIFAFQLQTKFESVDKEVEERRKESDKGTAVTPTSQTMKSALCEYNLEIKYPLTIYNCLPDEIHYRLTRLCQTMVDQADNFSRMSLSKYGRNELTKGDELYAKCFGQINSEHEHFQGQIDRVSKHKLLGISPDLYPLLTIHTDQCTSKSFIKLQKYILKKNKTNISLSGLEPEQMLDLLKRDTLDNQTWQEVTIHHLLDKEKKAYMNYLVHTSKLFHIYRVSISAQYWVLNELMNSIDLIFAEANYSFDPLTVPSSHLDRVGSLDESKLRDSGLVEIANFDLEDLDSLICTQNFRCITKREKYNLVSKHKSIRTFTGTPFDNNKKLEIFMRDAKADRTVNLAELSNLSGKQQTIHFSGTFKGEKIRRVEARVASFLLDKEFGGAELLLLAPAFILVNQTGGEVKFTFHSSYTSTMSLETDKFTPLVFRSEKGSDTISRTLYFNVDPKHYLWSAGMKLDNNEMDMFELKCISFKKQQPKILRVETEQKGVTKIIRLKVEDFARITIKNHTDLTFKVNQKEFDSYGEFISAHESIGFFWDDPFSEQVLNFQRLFNNKISDEKFSLELGKLTRNMVRQIELSPSTLENEELTAHEKGAVKLEVKAERIVRTDSIDIEILYVEHTAQRKNQFPIKKAHGAELENEAFKMTFLVRNLSISLIDDWPKELLFLQMENIHLNFILSLASMSMLEITSFIGDLQADFQINKASNKPCIITHRAMQKSKYPSLYFWANQQSKPFLKLEMNFFTHSNTQLINIRGRLAKLIFNLDGASFSKLYPMVSLTAAIITRAINIFFPPSSLTNEISMYDRNPPKPTVVNRYNINLREFEVDLFLERIPELIASLSNDYIAQIFSMLFSEICYFPIKFGEFNSETNKTETNSGVRKQIIDHYKTTLGINVIDLLSNTKIFGNPAKIFANLQEVLLNMFKENKNYELSHNPKQVFQDSFVTLFQAQSKASGNFEHGIIRQSIQNSGNSKGGSGGSILGLMASSKDKLIHSLYSIPFASNLIPSGRNRASAGDGSKSLISTRRPIRHPRFFFKNRILIPYSSLKAQLQMVVDNKDIEHGTFYFITDDEVILLANNKIYIVSKLLDHPVACIELDQIFSVQFVSEEAVGDSADVGLKGDEENATLKILYYDKSKFENEMSKHNDPFHAASKYMKYKFRRISPKVKEEFEQRMAAEKQNNFATFF